MMTGNGLGDAVFAVVNKTGMSTEEQDDLKAALRATYTAVVDYIVANMAISGIEVTTGPSFLNDPTSLVPVASDGGAAVSAQMVSNTTSKILVQNNNGTGRVS